MRAGIPNVKSRERTITLYLDKDQFREALGLPDEEHIYVLLFDHQGVEFWRARGLHNQNSEEGLIETLNQVLKQS